MNIAHRCLAEVFGTFILVFFGCGAVHSAVLTGAQSGLWQVAIVWGVAIMLAAYSVGGISGAHINPAMTISLAVNGRFAWRDVIPYIVSQVAGALLAAACLFVMFGPYLTAKEKERGVVRGQPGSEITAMCYGEYFPNPGSTLGNGDELVADLARRQELVPHFNAFFIETVGTFLLAVVVFSVTNPSNSGGPPPAMAPVFIGLTVAVLISVIAPLTQACFNPARDFGPRLYASLMGWGTIALPGSQNPGWLTVYIIAPILGAIAGGLFHDCVLQSRRDTPANSSR